MTYRDLAHTIFAFASLGSIGVGFWLISPAASLISVGSIVLGGIVYARTRK